MSYAHTGSVSVLISLVQYNMGLIIETGLMGSPWIRQKGGDRGTKGRHCDEAAKAEHGVASSTKINYCHFSL